MAILNSPIYIVIQNINNINIDLILLKLFLNRSVDVYLVVPAFSFGGLQKMVKSQNVLKRVHCCDLREKVVCSSGPC